MKIFSRKKKMLAVAIAVAASIGTAYSAPVYAAPDQATGEAVVEEAPAAVDAAQAEVASEPAVSADAVEASDGEAIEEVVEVDRNSSTYKWLQKKPSEDAMQEAFKKYEGRTIVSVNVIGASDDIIKAANVAVRSNPGDILSANLLQRDMGRLMDTGYFYDMYVGFREVPEGVAVEYNMLENPILTSIEIEGNLQAEDKDKLMEKITLKPGQRLNRRILHENMTAIQQVYVDDGYTMAKVNGLDVKDDGKLVIRINEGILEGFKVKGNKKTKEYVILREMRCKVGEPINRKQVQRSYQRINNLGFFESVDVKPLPGVEPNAVVLEIDVKEKNTGTFGIGMGYNSSEGFVGMISLADRNFRGTGDYLGVSAELGASDTDNRGWSINYRHPWLDRHETSLSLRIFNRRFEYDDYDSNGDSIEDFMRTRKGFEITFGRPQTEYTTNYLTLAQIDDRYDKHKRGNEDRGDNLPEHVKWRNDNFGMTRYIKLAHVTDTRDNYMYPMNGRQTTLAFTYAGLGGDFKYQKYEIDESRFYQVGHAHVIAVRGMYGYSPQDLPESAEFRIGGQDSVRGYRDDQFRGNGNALFKVEYRFPVSKILKGAFFADSGGAWDHGLAPKHFHASVGVGISLDTPMGALRLDIGRGSQGSRAHFNIGNTF